MGTAGRREDRRAAPTLLTVLQVHMPEHYRLHGLRIRVLSDHPTARRALHRALLFKGARPEDAGRDSASADATLDVSVNRPPAAPPRDDPDVEINQSVRVCLWKTAGTMILRHEDTTVELDPEAGVAEAAVASHHLAVNADGGRNSFLGYVMILSLTLLLRADGWFPLHAAGLRHRGHGVLLTAKSGSGKSTAALSLVRNGWEYLSDDTVLLRPEGGRITAYSFRRAFCVDPGTTAHFPELADGDWPPALSNPQKWQIHLEEVYPGTSAPSCTPTVIVLPDLVDARESHVEPAATKAVLEQLISEGAFFLAPDSDVADRHLAVLRRLIDQSQAYRLHAGRDVLEAPRTIHTLLVPLLEDTSPPGT